MPIRMMKKRSPARLGRRNSVGRIKDSSAIHLTFFPLLLNLDVTGNQRNAFLLAAPARPIQKLQACDTVNVRITVSFRHTRTVAASGVGAVPALLICACSHILGVSQKMAKAIPVDELVSSFPYWQIFLPAGQGQ